MLISLVLITLLAIGAVSAADDTAITDGADLAAADDVQTVDDAPTTDEINYESNDIIVTDTGDSSDLDDADSDVISDTGLKGDSDDGDEAVVSDASSPKNALKAEPLGAPEDDPVGSYKDLWTLISNAPAGSTITLTQNYAYNPSTDDDWYYRTSSGTIWVTYTYWYCADGLYIDKNLVINGNGHYISGGNAARIFDVVGSTLTLNNLILKEGKSSDTRNWNNNHIDGYRQYGGAIYAHGTGVTLNINNCTLTDNHNDGNGQYYSGGAIYSTGTTTILNSILTDNSAYNGGAFTIAGGTFTVHGSVIFDNTASSSTDTFGNNGYRSGGSTNFIDNWWGSNKGPENTLATTTAGTSLSVNDWFILTETLSSPTTVDVDFELYRGGTSQYKIPGRLVTITTDADTCNTTTAYCPDPFVIEFTTSNDAYINASVDHEQQHLKVFAGENKKNITVLRVEVEDVTLPDQPVAHVYSDVDGVYNLTLGSQVIPVTVTNGEGTYQFSGLNVGQYTVIVSRVDDPVYKTTFNTTDFEVKRYATQLSIDTETPTTTYGTAVTITHELTPNGPTGFITYYVDGSETGTQLGVNEDFVLSGLAAGTHTVVAKYGGDGSYDVSQSEPLTIVVNPATLEFNVTNVTVNYPNKGTVNVTSNVDGIYTVTVNNVDYQVTVGNGKGSFEVDQELQVGEYVISWNIPAGNYTAASGTGFYNVTAPAPEFDITGAAEINYGQTNTITHTITEGATGTITYTVNGANKGTLGLDENLVLENLDAGHYVVVAAYSGGGNYGPTSDTFEFDVLPIDVSVTVTSPEVVYPNKGTIVLTASAPGTYTVKVGDKTYTATVTTANESVEVPVTDTFEVGAYGISVTADLGDNYNPVDTGKIGTYTVTKPATSLVITVTDFTYGADASATITLKQGETALAGKTVNVTIDGTQQTVTIGADGTATVDLSSFGAGKHNIVAIFEGDDNYALAYNITEFNVNKANPTLTVTTEAINYGQDATINIALEGVNGEKLNGVVKVTIDGKDYDVPVTNGAGTLTVSGLAANEEGYAITAAFAGNDNYNEITDNDAKQVVNKVKPTLVIGHVEIIYGEDAVVTITLEGVNGEKLNGIVMAYVNGTDYRDVIVENGVGCLTATGLAVGEYNIQTRYNGNENYTATGVIGESAIIVKNAAINVTAQDVSVTYPGKGSITITTDVAGAYTIKVGDNTYENVELVAGENTFAVPDALEVGVYTVKVSAEIENYDPLVDEEIATYTVNQADVIISISANATEITYGDSVSMAAVISPDAITDDDITYYVDGTAVTSATLADLPAGTHTVVAKFAGDKNYKAAESNAVTITVNKAEATINVDADKYEITYGETVELSSVVTPAGATGDVTYYVDDEPVDSAILTGLTGGEHTVYAKYAGDDNFNAAVSEPITITVNKAVPTVTVSSDKDEVEYGETAELSSEIPADATGDVTYYVDGTAVTSATLADLPAGTHTVVAKFAGDKNYKAAESEPITVYGLPKKGTYTDLQYQIDKAISQAQEEGEPWGELSLEYDFEFDREYDLANNPDFINGVVVNDSIFIKGNGVEISGEEQARIFNLPTEADVQISSLILSEGNAGDGYGGAIYSKSEDLQLYDILFSDNYARKGGAIYVDGADGFVMGSFLRFKNNDAEEDGGAVYVASAFKAQGEFSSNSAEYGGAIFVAEGGEISVDFAQFNMNEASSGSSIYLSEGSKVNDLAICNFEDNTDDQGATVVIKADDVEIKSSNFTSNDGKSGSLYWTGDNGKLTDCNFTENQVRGTGSVVSALGDNFIIDSCNFDSNVARNDGIIYLEGKDAELNKVTIQNNNAGKGAIVLNDATISIADSLFKDNIGEALNYNIYNQGTIESITRTTFETIKPTITMDDSFAFGEVIPVNGTFDWGVKSPEMTMSFTVNGVPMEATVIDGKFAMNIDTQPDVGAYTVVISTFTDAKGNTYVVDTVTKTFEVTKQTPVVEVNDTTAEWNTPVDIPVKVTDENGNPLTGSVIITVDWRVDGVTQVVELDENGEGKATFRINQALGEMTITANYTGNDNYKSAKETATLTITGSSELSLEVTANEVTYGDETIITVTAEDGSGEKIGLTQANVTVDDGEVQLLPVGADGTINLGKLAAGEHKIVVSFVNEFYEEMASAETVAKVNPTGALIEATVANYAFDETGKLIINVTDLDGKVLNGTVAVEIDDEILSTDIEVEDGEATVDLTGYAIGEHSAHVIFYNPNYRNVDVVTHFNVTKKTPVVSVTGTTVEYGTPATVKITVSDDGLPITNGTVIVTVDWIVDGQTVVIELEEGAGEATFVLNDCVPGTFDITATYIANDYYNSAVNNTEKIIVTESTDLSLDVTADEVTYGGNTTLTITATDGSGAPVDLAKVNVTIDGVTEEYAVEDGKVNVGILPAGVTEITVSVDDGVHKYAEDNVNATVSPAVPDLIVTPGEAQVTIDVKDGDEPISGIATVYIDGDIENPITVNIDETGHAVVPIDAAPGTHAVEVIFNNENYTQARQTVAVNVPKLTPVVSVTGTEVEYGTPATVKVKVTDEEGNPVTGTVIVVASWEVDVETQVVELDENGEGEATFTLAGLGQGETADVNATFIATDKYASVYNDTEKINITPSSELNLEVSANEVTVGQDTVLTITATDGSGAAVDLAKVNVTIDEVTKEYPVENGQVTIGQLPVGTTEITVSYDDEFYEPAQASVNATVNKAAADVTVTSGEGNVTIVAKDNATDEPISGTATIVIDGGEPKEVTIGEDGTIEYPIDAAPGPHTVEVTFTNDDYEPVTKTVTVIVPKYTTDLSIATEDTPKYGDDVTVKTTITEGATGTITYYVDGSTAGTELAIGEDFVVSGLSAGEHNITAKYAGDDLYGPAESNVLTINVAKAELVITIDSATTYYPNTGVVNVSANNDGVYTINVNGKPYNVTIAAGKGTFEVTEVLSVAEYPITWDIAESENYTGATGSAVYKVLNTEPDFSITGTGEIDYGKTNTIVPTINADATGNITYSINGGEATTLDIKENFVTDVLDAGHYTVTATYSGDVNYGSKTATFEFDVLPIDVVVSVASDEVYYPNTGSINLTASAPGTYTVLVGNKTYTAVVTEANVPVVVEVEQLEVGKYEINVTAPASTNYNAVDTGAIGTYVVSKAQSAIKVTYDPDTGKATVTLEGKEDHVKLNETISFELDGTSYSGIKTTDGVYVSEDLELTPGKHSIFVVFVGNENYLGSYDQVAFEVDKFATAEVTVSADPIKEGEDAIIQITVKDGDKGLSGVVTVTLDGTDYAVDVTDGVGTLTVKNLVATETPTTTYPITAKFNGNDEYAEATGTGSIDVTDYNDVIIVISGGDEGAVATLVDTDMNNINGKVNVTVDGEPMGEFDVVDGKVNITPIAEGDHEITVDYLGDETHKPASATETVYVGKNLIPTKMIVTVADIKYTEDAEAVVVLSAEDGSKITGTVTLTIGDKVQTVTITDGHGTAKVSGLTAGTKTAIVEFASDGVYDSAFASTPFTVKQLKTRIVARNMTTTAINVTEDGRIGQYLVWTLVDEKGRPLEGKAMSIGFNANVYNRVTNASGQARLQINLQNSGTYTFAISFLGDDNYEGSFEVVKIDVNKQKATLTASGATYKASASTKTLSATYKTKAGKAIVGKTIKFTVNGKTYSAKTDSKGVAKVNVSLTKAGSYTVKITAPATNTYAEVNKTVTLKLT